jgi:hypothetical protein
MDAFLLLEKMIMTCLLADFLMAAMNCKHWNNVRGNYLISRISLAPKAE